MKSQNIISRFKKALGYSSDKQLAELFGISQQDFSNKKRRGTLQSLIIKHALNTNVNMNWLLTGEGNMYAIELAAKVEAKSHTGDVRLDIEDASEEAEAGRKVIEALVMAKRVLESRTTYADALYLNVVHFDRAIMAETRIANIERTQADAMGAFRKELNDIKGSTDKRISELERECAELKKENATLKRTGPVDPHGDSAPKRAAGSKEIPATNSTGRVKT
jgi:Sec-independent protein translocase protein TatA